MATRFALNTDKCTSTWTLGSQSALSASCWLRIVTDRNTYSTPWVIDNGAETSILGWQTDSDGTTLRPFTQTGLITGQIPLTVGTWYWVGMSMSGAAGTWWWKTPTTTAASVFIDSGQTTTTMSRLVVGGAPWGEWWNGDLMALKLWPGVALTDAEVLQEQWTIRPVRTAGLGAWHPLTSPDLADYSGNARTLTGGGTLPVFGAGPPVAWSAATQRRRRYVTPAPPGFAGWGVPIA